MQYLKLLLLLPLIFLAMTISAPKTYAASGIFSVCNGKIASSAACVGAGKGKSDVNGTDPIITVLKTAITILSYLIGIAAVITIIIAGLRMITGGANPESVSGARSAIIYAVVGIIVAIIAQLIVAFVLDRLS